jgi:pimeloyl-ACP methyl ester carboxylesterase
VWLPFTKDDLQADEQTIVIGHSTGALLAMRLLETHKVFGVILVAAAHTDLGDEGERASGYFPTSDGGSEWDWEAMKPNATFIHQFHSEDDHLIPVAEARFVAEKLKGDNHVYEELSGLSHFFEPFQQLLDAVDKYCPKNETIFE